MAGPEEEYTAGSERIQDADFVPSGEVTDTPWVRSRRGQEGRGVILALNMGLLLAALAAVVWVVSERNSQAASLSAPEGVMEAGLPVSESSREDFRLGFSARTVSGPAAAYFSAREDALVPGVQVYALEKDGPAALAGIQFGDIITAVEDVAVASEEDLARAEEQAEAGESLTLTVYRDGEYVAIVTVLPEG